jgi:single-stranded-DNA-specific exonuclease
MGRSGLEAEWVFAPRANEVVDALIKELELSDLVAVLLANRRIESVEQAREFLRPRLSAMPDPAQMKDMEKAVARIVSALERREEVCVWGDYDVDGVTSAAQLLMFFRALDFPCRSFVPDRFVDGYGLNPDRIRELCRDGVELFITVDCGITGVEAVEVATEEGADVVIVDHHKPGAHLPAAAAVLDPHREDCDFPEKRLAACGVTWVLLVALRSELRKKGWFEDRAEPDLKEWLDLTAIGTVCDMVELHGLNRAIVRHGLDRIAQSRRAGVRALCEVAGVDADQISAGRIGFHVGPRINAAGRIAHASAGLELLTTEESASAQMMALKVDDYNKARRAIQEHIEQMALEMAADCADPEARRTIVLAHEDWHPGVLGIVATRVVEAFYRPTILLSIKDGMAQGSARSIPGFPLVDHLRDAEKHLVKYGGHDHAAGLTLKVDSLDAFRAAFEGLARTTLEGRELRPRLKLDCEYPLRAVDFQAVHRIAQLEPYGQGNREPSLLAKGCRVLEARTVGKDRSHLKLTLEDGGQSIDAIAFGLAHKGVSRGDVLDVVYVPEINRFRGVDRLQIRVKALRGTHEKS